MRGKQAPGLRRSVPWLLAFLGAILPGPAGVVAAEGGPVDGEARVAALEKDFRSPDPKRRAKAVEDLGKVLATGFGKAQDTAARLVLHALKDRDGEVRKSARRASSRGHRPVGRKTPSLHLPRGCGRI